MEFAIWWEMGPEWKGDNSLDDERHRALTLWAADCAGHVLQFFERDRPDDDRPRNAIEAARAWHRGEVTVSETREYALAAQAAARDAETPAASEVARAAEHAIGAAEVDRHAKAAANHAIKAAVAANPRDDRAAETEANWQMGELSSDLRAVVFLEERAK